MANSTVVCSCPLGRSGVATRHHVEADGPNTRFSRVLGNIEFCSQRVRKAIRSVSEHAQMLAEAEPTLGEQTLKRRVADTRTGQALQLGVHQWFQNGDPRRSLGRKCL